jgi:predicted nucleic acid-binding protein
MDAGQNRHREAAQAMWGADGPFLVSPFVLAELDYLLATRVGAAAQQAALGEVERGAYRLEEFTSTDVGLALEIMRRYGDQAIGLADASIVVLAERYGCLTVLTLDERHFRVLRVRDKPFRILPADA